jgi:hypothetical protein
MAVQTNIAEGYLSAYERPIAVSVMDKTQQWPFLQQLSFASTLELQKETFHGLNDFKIQMEKYSSTNWMLSQAWKVIQLLVPLNGQVATLIYVDRTLGKVGKAFQSLQNFGQVFALSPTELQSPSTVNTKVQALS